MTHEKVLITSALPYANGPLHFGHIAGAYLPADCYARFCRQMGSEVLFLCGSDEYGVAISLSAEVAKRSPKEHVEIFHAINKELFAKLNFSFDHYSRTTSKEHLAPSQQFFLDLLANGYIEAQETEQLYSEQDKRFLADRYVTGTCPKCQFAEARGDECPSCGAAFEATDLLHPKSKLTGSALSLKKTKHWFLLLDRLKDQLQAWIETKTWKPNVLQFAKNYIADLKPRAITRDSDWGVPLPLEGTEGKVLYVWFDAPIGYITAAIEWAKLKGQDAAWQGYWLNPKTRLVQFIGKDNIPFHAAIFPAMCMGQNTPYKLVDDLPANEFYTLEGRQFSKSDGWTIDLEQFFKNYSADQIRYAIAASAPESSDSEFTWREFQLRSNSELLGKWGNLVNRILVFIKMHAAGRTPKRGHLSTEDQSFLEAVQKKCAEAKESFAAYRLRHASQVMMELAQIGNAYFDHQKPWAAAKEGRVEQMANTLSCCLECLKALALISYPIIPEAAEKVAAFLALPKALSAWTWEELLAYSLPEEAPLPEPQVLFRRIEDAEIAARTSELKKILEKKPKKAPPQSKPPISYEQFSQLDLRVGQIIAAEKIAKSKKLLKLQVDLGAEVRTIVSGLALSYAPEELIGQKVTVVANLAPSCIMGVESQGMVLAGDREDGSLELLSAKDLPLGSAIC
ncbi:MAG: metG [Chlamydiales bacterium]|nr:metG [Chlamydiales bacterium]